VQFFKLAIISNLIVSGRWWTGFDSNDICHVT